MHVLMGTMGRPPAIRAEGCLFVLHVFLRSTCQGNFTACLQMGLTAYLFAHPREQQPQKMWDSEWLWLPNKHLEAHCYSALVFWTSQRVAHCAVSWKSSFWHVKILPNPDSPSSKPMYTRNINITLCVTGLLKHYNFESSLSTTLPSIFSFE